MILVTADGKTVQLGRESLQTSGKAVPANYAQQFRAAVAQKIEQSHENSSSNQDMNWSKLGPKVVGSEHTG